MIAKIKSIVNSYVFVPEPCNEEYRNYSNHNYVKYLDKNISYFEYGSTIDYVIIWSHNYKMNAYDEPDFFLNLSKKLNMKIIVYDYMGYGFSDGKPNEDNCNKSLEIIIDHIKQKYMINTKKIYLIGHSLGSAMVMSYVNKFKWITPIILISPFKSAVEVATGTSIYKPVIDYAKLFVDIDSYDILLCKDYINKLNCPTIMIHSKDDELISIKQAKFLYEKLPVKIFSPIWIQNYTHDKTIFGVPFDKIFLDILNYQYK